MVVVVVRVGVDVVVAKQRKGSDEVLEEVQVEVEVEDEDEATTVVVDEDEVANTEQTNHKYLKLTSIPLLRQHHPQPRHEPLQLPPSPAVAPPSVRAALLARPLDAPAGWPPAHHAPGTPTQAPGACPHHPAPPRQCESGHTRPPQRGPPPSQ